MQRPYIEYSWAQPFIHEPDDVFPWLVIKITHAEEGKSWKKKLLLFLIVCENGVLVFKQDVT